jgi:hypothetical protein
MSDETSAQEVTNEPTPAKVKRVSVKAVPFSSIHVTFAKSKNIDVTRAGKLNRSFIRSNFDTLVKVWPELRASHKGNRDGNRYPATIPSNIATLIVKRDAAGLAALAKRKK